MEAMSEISQLNLFTLIGVVIFLIAIGLILPAFIIKDRNRGLRKNSWVVPETITKKDSMISSEKE